MKMKQPINFHGKVVLILPLSPTPPPPPRSTHSRIFPFYIRPA